MRRITWLTIAALFCFLPLAGQETRGMLLGRVTDPSDAIIIGAKVVATNIATGVAYTSTTNETGDYMLPFLIPGPYRITVERQGFRNYARDGIEVRQSERVTINIALEIGEASQTVDVHAETPLLDTSTASMGQVVDRRTIMELPLKDGMVLTLATLTPGVTFTPESAGYVRPFDTTSPSTMSVDGTRSGSNQFMVDGAANMQRGEVAYAPPPGVVEEFKVQTATFDASYGYMAGAAINMSLKSGTNAPHGQTYYFMQNPVLNADKFFRLKVGKPQFRLHRWGGNISGPVYLPKLYDGRNRTFFMYGYEGIWSFDPSPWVVESVPSAAQKTGNFSDLLAINSTYQIYDPYSTVAVGNGRFQRTPLPDNIIPASKLNPVALKIVQLWDPANQPGAIDGLNNYQMGKNAQDTYWNHIFRIDHSLSDRQRFYVRANFTSLDRPENERHNGAVGDTFFRFNRGAGFDHVYTASSTFFINTRYTLTRFITGYLPFQTGWDLASLGFSQNYINQLNQLDSRALKFPNINITPVATTTASGYSALGGINSNNKRINNIHEFAVNFTNVVGSHAIRSGVGWRVYQENSYDLGSSSGTLNFATDWTRGPFDNSPIAPSGGLGQGMAAFLYGLPTGGSIPINDSYAEQTKYWSFFVQDDWKVNRKLTISLGLRYELPSPLTERYNRSIRNFDPNATHAIEAQVLAAYAQNPIPQVPVSEFSMKGGLLFAGVGGQPRQLWETPKKQFMPRIGFAYSLTLKTVLRGGYGVYFEPLGPVGVHVNQTGFSQSTSLVASLDNGQNYIASLSDPFPSGLTRALGSAGGISTYLGQGVSFFDPALTNPYMQRWQFAVQRELPGNNVIEVSYVGNRGTRLRVSTDLNPIPREYFSTSPFRDQAAIDFLGAAVANPFYPLLPRTNLSGTTVARSQLLKPLPQFSSVSANLNSGYSWYHAMQVRYEKRFSTGLAASYSFSWSKFMEATGRLNATDIGLEEVISDQDRTLRSAVTVMYELPLGRGKRLGGSLKGFASKTISGWQIQGIYTAQSGAPLGFGNAIFLGDLKNIPLPKDQRTVDMWFNVNAGFERRSSQQLASNIRTFPSRFSGVRSDGPNNWDISLLKNTEVREGLQVQFRAEAINALNHPQFTAGSTNTSVTSSAFGEVTGEFAWPRVVQFGLKVLF
jgi:hypothetical protein